MIMDIKSWLLLSPMLLISVLVLSYMFSVGIRSLVYAPVLLIKSGQDVGVFDSSDIYNLYFNAYAHIFVEDGCRISCSKYDFGCIDCCLCGKVSYDIGSCKAHVCSCDIDSGDVMCNE